eukprot:CAMPEP_0206256242 /NCGR_PEP_ID=MMETSP0047_2-20121206/24664_1 /ASSEMBLY_ACC=CAM_ASM_000192 /TAXON_ID=195065 /ORGANISM="Chroomonas mesostigmatica_cf, Strain CCMP1168" /LENGTH=842 /DNA_ID=CAMNT_0053682671 /DNA_START=313 /DNA_END=2841 /DNA_ORIENTATION=+
MASQSSSCSHDDDDVAVSEPSAPDPSACGAVTATGDASMYGQFTWTVALPAAPADKDSLADISKIRQFSEVFEVGGYEWKLEMYPYGDSQSDKTLSVFLCAVDRKQLPGWSQTAHYQIAVVNKDPSKTSTHTGYDIFRGKRDSAWGWSKLINLSKLHDVAQGWVDDDGKITLQATVHVVTHEYMPVNRTYRKSLCGLYYERVLQSYFEPFLKDELQRLDKLCGNSVLHKGFSDFWAALADTKKRALLQITMDEVLLNVKARLFSRDQPATYLAADVIFKAAHECAHSTLSEGAHRSLVGCTSLAVVSGGEGTVLRLERLTPEASSSLSSLVSARSSDAGADAGGADQRVMLRTHSGVMRMSNSANFVDVFRAQVADALDNVRALVKHLKPQSCDGTCLEAMGRQMLAVFAMCGMYITNVHPAYHEKLALQLQEDLIREEEEKSLKAKAKKAKQAEKKKKQQELKAQKRAEEEEAKRKEEEEERKRKEEAAAKRKALEEEQAKKKAEGRRKAQEEAERIRKAELEAEEARAREETARREKQKQEEEARRAAEREKHAHEEEAEPPVAELEQAKRSQMANIMRDTRLSAVERQLRIQAILAGKIDVMSGGAAASGPVHEAPVQHQHQHQHQHQQQEHRMPMQQQQHQQHQQQNHYHDRGLGGVDRRDMHSMHMQPQHMQQHQQQHRHAPQPQHHQQHAPQVNMRAPQQQHTRQRSGPPLSAHHSEEDVDVEAYALGQMMASEMSNDKVDDIMAMATGMLDPPSQGWGEDLPAGIDSQSFGAEWDEWEGIGGAGLGGALYGNAYSDPMAAPNRTGSRLFERWGSRAAAVVQPVPDSTHPNSLRPN